MEGKSVEQWIETLDPGSVFSARDMPLSISRGVRDEMLSRFAKRGRIVRMMRGIYAIPMWSDLLQKRVLPSCEAIAPALARKFGWNILPNDETAANGLGLSTQVPARLVYLSDGPDRKYKIGESILEFRHRSLRETRMKNRDSILVIRGIRGLGKENATPDVVRQIASKYSDRQWRAICEEAALASDWILKLLTDELKRRETGNEV